MSEVKAWRARKVNATSFQCYGHRRLAHRVIVVGRRGYAAGGGGGGFGGLGGVAA
jgi:hypothetical protein